MMGEGIGIVNFISSIVELFGRVFALFGIDLLIVSAIAGAGQCVKYFFNPSKKVIFVVIFSLGLIVSLIYIFILGVEKENLLRVTLAYPLLSIAAYMLGRKYLKKYFNGSDVLSSTDEIREKRNGGKG